MKFTCSIVILFSISLISCSKKVVPLDKSLIERNSMPFLLCEECLDGELNQILLLGEDAIPFLQDVVEYGLPRHLIANIYQRYQIISFKFIDWVNSNDLKISPISPIENLNNINKIARLRAITAIAAIQANYNGKYLSKTKRKTQDPILIEYINNLIQQLQSDKLIPDNFDFAKKSYYNGIKK
ncbi:MAG: hypothetical protein R8P61_16420 [Bacteroidia bacterium]|nr:hypothetical protein [Bacteroidia bacterium]